jgi:hypothetical protein
MSAGFTRRSFTESLALAAFAPALGVRPLSRGAAWSEGLAPVAAVEDPGALARALAGVVRAQYGARLTRADVATITKQIQASLDRVAQIRKVELTNGDEPDFVFTALPAPGDSPR